MRCRAPLAHLQEDILNKKTFMKTGATELRAVSIKVFIA